MAVVLRSSRPARVLDGDARARLAALAPHIAPGALAAERAVEVHPALHALLPQGLVRGSTINCTGGAATSSAFLLAAAASQAGSWTGVAGLAHFGAQAAAEAGVELGRVVVVRERGSYDDGTWGQILAALVDGFDVVVFGAAARVRSGTARRVQARLQTRGAVLVLLGDAGGFNADLRVASRCRWQGLGDGHGHLRAREVELTVEGRRVPRPRRDTLWFPDAAGRITGRQAPTVSGASGAAPAATVPVVGLGRTG
jgi:hypothetical protein